MVIYQSVTGAIMHSSLPNDLMVRQLRSNDKNLKIIIYFVVGTEYYNSQNNYCENITSTTGSHDYVNWAWRNYGNTTGFFNLLDLLSSFNCRPSVMLNTDVYNYNYDVVQFSRKYGCEFVCHGKSNAEVISDMEVTDQYIYITDCLNLIYKNENQEFIGWSSPWLSHNHTSLCNLTRSKMSYLMDFRIADVPVYIENKTGDISLCALPYSIELNDSASLIERRTSVDLFYDLIFNEIEYHYRRKNKSNPVVISVVLHDFISGVPFRLNIIEKLLEKLNVKFPDIAYLQPAEIFNLYKGDI
jgi:hypothetical protein